MESIKNFVQLTDNIGTAGQPTENQFNLVADAGYRAVINLAMPDHADFLANEDHIVTLLGMTYIHIPVPFKTPEPNHVKQFCAILKSLEGERFFVHCIKNYRVSAFMYHYLHKVEGFDEVRARSAMFSQWEPNEVWLNLLGWSAEDIGL